MSTNKRKSFAQQIGQKVDQTLAKQTESSEAPQPASESATPTADTKAADNLPQERDGMHEIADNASEQPDAPKEIEFKKFTVPLRTDQLNDMADQLWEFGYKYRVDISKASLIRLALDRILDNLKRDPESVLRALYRLEKKELKMNEDRRKYSVSKGLAEYVEKATMDSSNH